VPFTVQQLVRGADYTPQTFNRSEPVDQINTQRRVLKWLMAHKEESTFGNGVYSTPVFMDNGGNYQRYFGAQQVTYNQRDPVRQAKYNYFRAHEGFWFDEDTLLANNITINAGSNIDERALAQRLHQELAAIERRRR